MTGPRKKAAARANLWTFNYIFFAAVWKHERIEWRGEKRAWWKLSNLLRSFLITFCSIFSPVSSRRERLNLDLFTMGDKEGRTFQLSTRDDVWLESLLVSTGEERCREGMAQQTHPPLYSQEGCLRLRRVLARRVTGKPLQPRIQMSFQPSTMVFNLEFQQRLQTDGIKRYASETFLDSRLVNYAN